MRRPTLLVAVVALLASGLATLSSAYPLSGYERTGIRRLWAYDAVERGELPGRRLPAGALMPLEGVRLRMLDRPDFDVTDDTARDPALQAGIEQLLTGREQTTSIAVLDLTDPENPRYGALNEQQTYLPGSVGKLLVAVGLFDALARAHDDPAERLGLLRNTWIEADSFVEADHHTVPVVDVDEGTITDRAIRPGDRFTLYEWLDHMLSPSSNAAGATVWKQAMLLREFGRAFPPTPEEERAYLYDTPKPELTADSLAVIEDQTRSLGLNIDQLRQGTLYTRGGTAVIPGVGSHASPRELLRLLIRLEQGKLIDEFSSLELKRLLYYTKSRYRYAVSPALSNAAVYFKSGSFYRCKEEEGFRCRQYAGNVQNVMNSVTIVENPAMPEPGQQQRVYISILMSNVLRKNSAEDHRDLATAIDRLIADLNSN
jgi:hypothetical protein